jgi:hypothetical protein
MSMVPTGDKGQRYEVACWGYPRDDADEKMIIGWTEQLHEAERMAKAIAHAPGCVKWSIRDRWKATPEWPGDEYTQMVGAGGLR